MLMLRSGALRLSIALYAISTSFRSTRLHGVYSMTDLYPHFSYLLDKTAEQRAVYLSQQNLNDEELAMLTRLLSNCERMTGDTQWLAQLQMQVSEHDHSDLTQLSGKQIGPYCLQYLLGKGGMGAVYLAHRTDGLFEQRVAFKFLYPSVATMAGESLLQEAQLLAKMSHPAITQVLDAGSTTDGLHYIMMEYVQGQPLDKFLQTTALNLTEKVQLFLQLVDAICATHGLNIVHGDLKPANILVTQTHQIKLLDFGVAKQVLQEQTGLTRVYLHAMSLPYAAPEQLDAAPVSAASDQYALGALFYQCLTGQPAFTSASMTFAETLSLKKQRLPPVWPLLTKRSERWQVRLQLEHVVQKALAVKPQDRYASVLEFRSQLQSYLQQRPLQHQQQWYWRSGKWLQRNPIMATLGAVLFFGFGLLAIQNQQIRLERNNAEQVVSHLAKLFQATDPKARQQPEVPATELLQFGEVEITNNPNLSTELRWQLLQVIAESYFNIGDYARAEQLTRTLFNQQISAGQVQASTLRFYCTISEYFKAPFSPSLVELNAISDYFTDLSERELLTPEHASAWLSLLTSLNANAELLKGYDHIAPYLPKLVALYPDNRWKMAALLQAETRWQERTEQLETGHIDEAKWLEFNKKDLETLEQSIATTDPLHPNYVDLIAIALNLARIVEISRERPELPPQLYQQLEHSIRVRQQTLGLSQGSVTQALDAAILSAEYLDDWALMERNIDRLARHIDLMDPSAQNYSGLLRQKAALYLRQGRRQDLVALNAQLTVEFTQQPQRLASYSFFHLMTLADGLTAFEEKQALATLLPWLGKSLQMTALDDARQQFYQQQIAGRHAWVLGKPAFVKPQTDDIGWSTELFIEMALLNGHDASVKPQLNQALANVESQLKRCPPTYCANTLLITVLPLKLAQLELAENNLAAARPLLQLVEDYAVKSNNSQSNSWLQQVRFLKQQHGMD